MRNQNKYGLIFFFIAFTIVLAVFSFFIPESSKNSNQKSIPINETRKPWEMDWNTSKSKNQLEEQPDWDNGIITPHQQEQQNSSSQISQKSHSISTSYSDNESRQYIYSTQPTEVTNNTVFQASDNYYQNTESNSRSSTRDDNYSTSNNINSTSIPATAPAPQPTYMTSCDGSGCWDNQGNRYSGNNGTYFQSNGSICRDIGGQMQCN